MHWHVITNEYNLIKLSVTIKKVHGCQFDVKYILLLCFIWHDNNLATVKYQCTSGAKHFDVFLAHIGSKEN